MLQREKDLLELIHKAMNGLLNKKELHAIKNNEWRYAVQGVYTLYLKLLNLTRGLTEVLPHRFEIAKSLTLDWRYDDKYQGADVPREIMHARFLEHHAKARTNEDYGVVSELLAGAAAEIRQLYLFKEAQGEDEVESPRVNSADATDTTS